MCKGQHQSAGPLAESGSSLGVVSRSKSSAKLHISLPNRNKSKPSDFAEACFSDDFEDDDDKEVSQLIRAAAH